MFLRDYDYRDWIPTKKKTFKERSDGKTLFHDIMGWNEFKKKYIFVELCKKVISHLYISNNKE